MGCGILQKIHQKLKVRYYHFLQIFFKIGALKNFENFTGKHNSYHDSESAFFDVFFEKDPHLNAVQLNIGTVCCIIHLKVGDL